MVAFFHKLNKKSLLFWVLMFRLPEETFDLGCEKIVDFWVLDLLLNGLLLLVVFFAGLIHGSVGNFVFGCPSACLF